MWAMDWAGVEAVPEEPDTKGFVVPTVAVPPPSI
jgi:hypothetical protein